MMRKTFTRLLCVVVAAFMLCASITTAIAAQASEPVQERVFYDSVPLTLTITTGNATSLERAYAAITANRPAYSTITSLKIVTDGNTSINLNDLQGEDVLFLKKLTSLQKIDLSAAAAYGNTFSIPEGVFTGMTKLEEVILNDNTRTIGIRAFEGCTNLHTIKLDKVTAIKESAFKDCISLPSVNTIALTELGASAFEGCSSLESAVLTQVPIIESNAFNNCLSLKTVGNTAALRAVKESAFADCGELTGINLTSVNNPIGAYAFYNCANLEKTESMALTPAIEKYAFYNCSKLKTADLTAAATLGSYAFYGCSALEEVKTGLSLRTITAGAFENCTSLKTMDLKRITTIQNAAFRNCKALNNLDFTDCTSIGLNAFYGCSSMDKAAVMPTKSASLANNAFKYCAFDFSNGYPANTPLNEHNAPAQRPALVFALSGTDTVDYKIGAAVNLEDLYTIKTASGADYKKLISDNLAWMGATLDDIKVTTTITWDDRNVDSIDTNTKGKYSVTLKLPGTISSNTNELKLTVNVSESGGQWREEEGKKYFYEGSVRKTGWLKFEDKWYYLDPTTGAMQTGWQQVNGKWYYMADDGIMQVGWQKIGSNWYYLKSSGEMAIGWQQVGGKWYYLKSSGAMLTGWLQLSGKWYYLDSSGAMVTGKQTINGKTYTFNASGAMQ